MTPLVQLGPGLLCSNLEMFERLVRALVRLFDDRSTKRLYPDRSVWFDHSYTQIRTNVGKNS